MKRSRNEFFGMLSKAARGAGCPTGQAEIFAEAVSRADASDAALWSDALTALSESGEKATLSAALSNLKLNGKNLIVSLPSAIDEIVAGADRIVLEGVQAFALVQAYMAWAERTYELPMQASPSGPDIVITPADGAEPLTSHHGPIEIDEATWTVLGDYAARTFVPETEASRLVGAGAGLTDND